MATIDLIVLGIVKKEPLSAYDIQKLVEYRNISRWVKIKKHINKIRRNAKHQYPEFIFTILYE